MASKSSSVREYNNEFLSLSFPNLEHLEYYHHHCVVRVFSREYFISQKGHCLSVPHAIFCYKNMLPK